MEELFWIASDTKVHCRPATYTDAKGESTKSPTRTKKRQESPKRRPRPTTPVTAPPPQPHRYTALDRPLAGSSAGSARNLAWWRWRLASVNGAAAAEFDAAEVDRRDVDGRDVDGREVDASEDDATEVLAGCW